MGVERWVLRADEIARLGLGARILHGPLPGAGDVTVRTERSSPFGVMHRMALIVIRRRTGSALRVAKSLLSLGSVRVKMGEIDSIVVVIRRIAKG